MLWRSATRPAPPRCSPAPWTSLPARARGRLCSLRSAAKAVDLAERALAGGLPCDPHRGESWVLLALAALVASDALNEALRVADEILTEARARGSALTVVAISSLRALIELRRGNLLACQADA